MFTKLISHLRPWDFVVLIIPAIALLPLLHLQSVFLWEREHLQFFPLACAAVAYFFYAEGRADSIREISQPRRKFAIAISVFATLLGMFGLYAISPLIAHVTIVVCIFAWATGRFGNLTILRIVGICGLIAVTVPPPFQLDKAMVTGLQSLSSTICSGLMDVTGILHLQRGNVIEISSKPLFVEEACSGVDSQYALMALAGVLLLLARTGFIVSAITIVTVPIWAILGNLLRIYSIVIGLEFLNIDLAVGFKHTLLGLCSFAGAAYAHWSSVQFLNYLQYKYFPQTTEKYAELNAPASTSLTEQTDANATKRLHECSEVETQWNRPNVGKWMYGLSIALLFFMPMGIWGWYSHFLIKLPSISTAIADAMPGERDLPRVLASSTRVHFTKSARHERNALGQHSHTWNYASRHGPMAISFDFPFRGFHPLWECYTNAGWRRRDVKELSSSIDGTSGGWRYFEVLFDNKEGEYGCLHFAFFDELGQIYNYEGPIDVVQPNRTAVNFFEAMSKPIRDLEAPLLFQLQVFSKLEEPIPEEHVSNQRELFVAIRPILMKKSQAVFDRMRTGNRP